ncbi:MAG: universal stress protein [Pseudomonadota bacterium]
MYRKILVPIEPSHQDRHAAALDMAYALRADETAEVIALTVIEPVPSYVVMAASLPDLHIKAGEKTLTDLQAFVTDRDATQTKVLHGHPANEINSFAESEGVDCIVIASHKPELVDYLLGSTAARVVRHAPCSVHVMR